MRQGLGRPGAIAAVQTRLKGRRGVSEPTPSHITDNLVLHLDAGNVTSYSGSGSTTWTDLSNNSRNATLTDVTYTSDNSGALVFNG